MNTRLEDRDVLETLTAMRPDADRLAGDWHAERRHTVLRKVLAEPVPRPATAGAPRWIGAALAVAAVAAATFVLLPGMLGGGRSIEAVPGWTPGEPVTEPTWFAIDQGPLSPRYEAGGAWVAGRYLVVGGHLDPCGPRDSGCTEADREILTDGALYDPATDSWTSIAPMPRVENLSVPAVLGSSVYFLTGIPHPDGSPTSSDEFQPGEGQTLLRYQVESDSWTSYQLPQPAGGQLVATDSAVILLTGNDQDAQLSDLVFHPDSAGFTELPDDPLGPGIDRSAVWVKDRLVLSALPLDATDGAGAHPLGLAVLDSSLTTWTLLNPTEAAYGWKPLAVGDRVLWRPDGARAEVVDDRRTFELVSSLDPATGEVTTIRAPYQGYGGYPAGSLGSLWVATRDEVVVEGALLDPVRQEWTNVPPLELPEAFYLGAVVAGENSLLIWGGDVPGHAEGRLLVLPE